MVHVNITLERLKLNKRGGIVMAWCFCDIYDYNDKCENYRKVVVCPYMKTEE